MGYSFRYKDNQEDFSFTIMHKKRSIKKSPPHISLKWKVATIFGSVFLLIHIVLTWLAVDTLQEQFLEQRKDAQSRHEKTISLLLTQSSRLLQQIGETIPLFSEGLNEIEIDRVIATLDNFWGTFQLTWGLDNIQYYSGDLRIIKTWGAYSRIDKDRIHIISNTEEPSTFIACNPTCIQYVGIPVMGPNLENRILVIGKNLADLIIDFNKITHAQIGILVDQDNSGKETGFIAGYRLAGISNPTLSTKIIEKSRTGIPEDNHSEIIVSEDERKYELRIIRMADLGNDEPKFIIIDDITDTLRNKHDNLINYLTSGAISLCIGMFLLLILLRIPMERLTKIAKVLPFLAEGKYKFVRNQLSRKTRYRTVRDEIGTLEQTILYVTKKLESLQNEVNSRTKILLQQREMLEKERNFIQELLDTAPLIILTQDKSGNIITINRFGKKFLPISNAIFLTAKFNYDNMFLSDCNNDIEAKKQLTFLRLGKSHKAQFDTILENIEPHSRHIAWHHTRLEGTHPKSPAILSIGLDITDRKIAEERLIWLADHDPLTHLYNRRRFQQEFERILRQTFTSGSSGALLYFDLDQFKYVNDTCGHKVGDSLLQLIADKLRHITRQTDILARLGGDEFALAIPNIEREQTTQLAEKIFASLQSIDFKVEGQLFKITVSIGIAMFPQHGQNLQDLLANADLAMYQAKEAGRGRIQFYSPGTEFQNKIKTQVYWKDQIERAFIEDRFFLYYQPILDIRNQSISHYECLLRMTDSEGNFIVPGQFIPIAEQLGMINLIDRMVVKKALDQHKSFNKLGMNITLSINLSGQALNDLELQRSLHDLLSQPDINPEQIIFEITETTAVSNFSSAQRLMNEIKSLGCSFAIDDFGVGFSSFYYLMHLPVDYVKIDGSFIKSLNSSKEDQVLVRALAEIAQGLGKKTIAEFVENREILDILHEFGVHYAQGYYIGKPEKSIPSVSPENIVY